MPAVSNLRPTADRDGQPYPMPLLPLTLTLPLTLIVSPPPSGPLVLAPSIVALQPSRPRSLRPTADRDGQPYLLPLLPLTLPLTLIVSLPPSSPPALATSLVCLPLAHRSTCQLASTVSL